MTAKEIKQINKEIARLRSKIIRLESGAFKITPTLSEAPAFGSSVSDKVGNSVAEISDLKREIQNLEILRNSALNRLSRENYIENCLFMRLSLRYSWAKIALQVGGDNTPDSVRMMCERYEW